MDIGAHTPVVVAGGASGLGSAVVRHFAGLGAPVGFLDRDEAAGKDLADELDAVFAPADVSDWDSVNAALSALRAVNGQERICVNCAGIAPAARTVSRSGAHDPALFAKVVAVNLVGTFNVATLSATGMSTLEPANEDGERGIIINTASVAAFEGQIGQVAYAASKGGVAAMTLPMARDLAGVGIRVVTLAPGIFATPMVSAFSTEVQDALAQSVPFPRRLGQPEEFARMAAALVETTMMNGEVVRIDGAIRMQPR
ncbi:SDR family NAD(P)-dependent oxidoreductase [Oceaniradius stylonematis]|uniref:SDR family NAD(P)-dependent oxidoreductase n=1 Tax=Oceaniradius stylonematis TaxID=2184161 RepID=A0A3A8AC43_9HYPH|nr:SDR family NAD(P)-dependent oxidoreductase [Oceaniradius stylonematis]RKF06898.1 SDR family NAD(P)-dependent oxidoreductase [Oceaniradius stylonematis]